MTAVINRTLKIHKNSPRIYIDSALLNDFIIDGNLRFDRHWKDNKLALVMNAESGKYTLSTKKKDGDVNPVLDINTKELSKLFKESEMLRIAIDSGKIIISAHIQANAIEEREQRFKYKLLNNVPLEIGSPFHGTGGMDLSLHTGMAKAGVKTTTNFAIEIESRYLENSKRNNQEIFNKNTTFINSDIALVNYSLMRQVDGIYSGIPCNGASSAGVTKNKLNFAEQHDRVGVSFFTWLNIVQKANPAYIVLENVKQYFKTASYAIIGSVLEQWGYVLKSFFYRGSEYGALEDRERMVMIAVSKGLASDDFFEKIHHEMELEKTKYNVPNLADIIENLPEDHKAWKEVKYLKEKSERDIEAKKGFRLQVIDLSAKKISCLGAGYAKARTGEDRLKHPNKEGFSRLFTAKEHARFKSLPEKIITGLPETIAHQVLGNSVIGTLFESVGYVLIKTLRDELFESELKQAA